jgi:hypothetical protein
MMALVSAPGRSWAAPQSSTTLTLSRGATSGKVSGARWAVPALVAVLGAAGVAWGIRLLTSHGAPSCDLNPAPGCRNGPNNTAQGADLTTAGTLLLLGSSAYLVNVWLEPPDGSPPGGAARGVVFQAHF